MCVYMYVSVCCVIITRVQDQPHMQLAVTIASFPFFQQQSESPPPPPPSYIPPTTASTVSIVYSSTCKQSPIALMCTSLIPRPLFCLVAESVISRPDLAENEAM